MDRGLPSRNREPRPWKPIRTALIPGGLDQFRRSISTIPIEIGYNDLAWR